MVLLLQVSVVVGLAVEILSDRVRKGGVVVDVGVEGVALDLVLQLIFLLSPPQILVYYLLRDIIYRLAAVFIHQHIDAALLELLQLQPTPLNQLSPNHELILHALNPGCALCLLQQAESELEGEGVSRCHFLVGLLCPLAGFGLQVLHDFFEGGLSEYFVYFGEIEPGDLDGVK